MTDENKRIILEALLTDFLTEDWEEKLYAASLIQANEWGKKIDEEKKKYKQKHKLVNQYNN